MALLDDVKFNEAGLVPVIAQEAASGHVLMLAWANREALQMTLDTGFATYYSRSRRALWKKGEESGNVQKLIELRLDCDADAVLYLVEQVGGIACHTGHESCFYRACQKGVWTEIAPVLKDPKAMYQKN